MKKTMLVITTACLISCAGQQPSESDIAEAENKQIKPQIIEPQVPVQTVHEERLMVDMASDQDSALSVTGSRVVALS